MARGMKRLVNNHLCTIATNLILAIGVLAFVYVVQQASHGGMGSTAHSIRVSF